MDGDARAGWAPVIIIHGKYIFPTPKSGVEA